MDFFKHFNQTEIMDLCSRLDFPDEVKQTVSKVMQQYAFVNLQKFFDLLFDVHTGDEGVRLITSELEGNSDAQWIWLTVYLSAALIAEEEYHLKGIPDSVFIDTMRGSLRLFLYEHKESYGVYGFDRAYWPFRHVSLKLFRLGTLSFEMREWKGKNVLSVHIPSDSNLTEENCIASYRYAIGFFKQYFPEFNYDKFICSSWLLSPNLQYLLDENSKIIKFQKRYTILEFDEDNESYKTWLYKNRSLSIDEFPQNTSLQRKAKQFLVDGGKIGAATGWFSIEEITL